MELRGHLDLLLLATLRDTGPAHGYAIITSLRERCRNFLSRSCYAIGGLSMWTP